MLKDTDTTQTVKTTWRLPKDLVKQFKHLATDRETTVTMLVIAAMKHYLEKPSEFNKKLYKPNIDYLKKEEFVNKLKHLKREKKGTTPLLQEIENYLTIFQWSFWDTYKHTIHEDKEELVKELWNSAKEGQARVATVMEAIEEVRLK
jgi:paraquat-inducible protein B